MSRQRGAEKVIVGRQRCTARHHDQVYTGVAHRVTAERLAGQSLESVPVNGTPGLLF